MTDTTPARAGTNLIVLTDEEWARVTAVAKARMDRNRGGGREGRASLAAQEIGVAAEVAFGLAAGMDPAAVWDAAASPSRTPGWHYVMDGTTIKVQGTDRPGHLIQRVSSARAEIYVLGYVKAAERSVSFLGWVPRHDIVNAERRTTTGPGWEITSYWVRANDLEWMSRLWRLLEVAA